MKRFFASATSSPGRVALIDLNTIKFGANGKPSAHDPNKAAAQDQGVASR